MLLVLVLCFAMGCASFWDGVREDERDRAQAQANRYFKEDRCELVLAKLDRAESADDPGRYAAVATYQRAVCLSKLGRNTEARAHYLMLADFYPDDSLTRRALAGLGGSAPALDLSEARATVPSLLTSSGIEIPAPRYTQTAERSKLVGSVIALFTVGPKGEVSEIRVIDMSHPLLASWSIEAVARAKLKKGTWGLSLPMKTVTHLVFSSHWHGAGEDEASSGSAN